MAKYERSLKGNFNELLACLQTDINSSISATCEDSSSVTMGSVKIAVRVYERYSMMGGNRVSLNITLVGDNDNNLFLSAISAGGSQAVFFKINTFGEEAFLNICRESVENYISKRGRG